ncbi:unnamed protein product [Rotaria sordida]|uniref:Alpha-mannosidase n=1 Tax=Rotaria sordida TaxID=392033 RepID=A0A818V2G0_9BILA|nr:unnamed protein product [Rotaria sordida]
MVVFDISILNIRGDLKSLLTNAATRIVVLWAEPIYRFLILQKALDSNVVDPYFTWILSGSVPLNSLNETFYQNLIGMFLIEPAVESVVNAPINATLLNAAYSIWQQYEPESFPGSMNVDNYALFVFDATWTLIQSLQQVCASKINISSLHLSSIGSSYCFDRRFIHSKLLLDAVSRTEFLGVSGPIQFSVNVTDRITGLYYSAKNAQSSSNGLSFVSVLEYSHPGDWRIPTKENVIICPGNSLTQPIGGALLKGVNLRIDVIGSVPFTIVEKVIDVSGQSTIEYSGYVHDLIELLQNKMEFIPTIELAPSNQTYNGLVRAVRNEREDNEALQNQSILPQVILHVWYSFGNIVGYGVEFHTNTAARRLLTAGLYILSLILVASYTANLASELTIAKSKAIISGIDDIKNGKIPFNRIGILVDSAPEEYYLREISNGARNYYPLQSLNDLYLSLLINMIDAAFWDSGTIEYVTNNIYCNLTIIGNDFDKSVFARSEIRHRGVQYIIDSVIQALLENPDRRYIYVEMAFFWRWWNQQSDDIHNTVRQLVNEGRLEFISGGWSMHDEGATHYNSIIDQHSLGAEFLRDQFGDCARPKIGWQIDPFGHSREVASLFAQQENGSNVNVFYSTPSCYLYALNKANKQWTSKTDDFFPYATHSHGFWTGYFTSRATFKGYERYSNNILQVTRQLNAFSQSNRRNTIFYLSEAMGVVQHHDAISGTERQHVADDYVQQLSYGIERTVDVINDAYNKLLLKEGQTLPVARQFLCSLSNISECLPIEGQDQFTLTLWNPTIHPVTIHPHVPVTREYLIRDPMGNLVSAEYLPISDMTKTIPGRISTAQNQYIFKALLPALGYNTCYFEARSFPSNSSEGFQASGAYMFRPWSSHAQPVSSQRIINCTKTKIVQSAFIVFNEWATQQITLYPEALFVEIEWTLGPIPVDDGIGKEIIIRYDTNINSASKYYTDANGREVLERIRDYRPTWNYSSDEPISGNYYPINSRIWIRDNQSQLTILTDRSEGGGSMHDGSIEIMLHRRILYTDGISLNEPLNETAYSKGLVVRGRHHLFVEPPTNSARMHRIGAQQLFMYPLTTYSLPDTSSYTNYSMSYRQTWSALSDTMPLNVHLLTFDQLSPEEYLVRLEHYFELNEDEIYSQPVTIDLQVLFATMGTIVNVQELILSANLPLSDLHRLEWITNNGESSYVDMSSKFDID